MKKKYPGAFKFKIALEVLKGDRTLGDICREHNISPSVAHKWKNHLKSYGIEIFNIKSNNSSVNKDLEKSKLYEEIGRLKVEVDFLKKVVGN
ncbi:MAG: transposase [Bacteroidales bacterium]|nr:transposase [Bacteroidales bacterium]